jgi:putative ABC transport system permease protein
VLQEGLHITLIGVTLGLTGAPFLSRVMAGYVYGITSPDPLTFASTSLILIAVAFCGMNNCLVTQGHPT